MSKVIHISQPRIYPHISYFDKVSKSDLFVVSDDLENQKGKFELRNKYFDKLSQSPKYLNVPIESKAKFKDIVLSDGKYHLKHREILKHSYKDYPYFSEDILELLIPEPTSLWYMDQWEETFVNIMFLVMDSPVYYGYASSLGSEKKKVERLEEIIHFFKGTEYLSGIAGKEYIKDMSVPYTIHTVEEDKFSYRGEDKNFYMIADTIFTLGVDKVKEMLR